MLMQRPWVQIPSYPSLAAFFFRLICIWLDCCYNDSDNICKLNPLTKHTCRCGEGAWWNRREPQANLEGNHDNPVSGSLQAPSHWDLQWRNAHILTKKHPKGREGKAGSKNWATCKATACESNMSKMIDFRESTVKYARAQEHPIYN